MAWPPWPKGHEKALASYVLADTAERLRLAANREDLLARGKRRELLEAIYAALLGRDIRYARPPFDPTLDVQRIREPEVILRGAGDGTCLDLALLFAGLCLGNELLPLVVVLDGHALVAVSLVRGRDDADAPGRRDPDQDGTWVGDGLLKNGDTLRELVARGDYLPIECTGFARSETIQATLPEGKGRVGGRLTFERAIEAGSEQLGPAGRAFAFAIDVAMLQKALKIPSHDPDAHARDNSIAIVSVLQHRPPPPITAEELAAAEHRLAGLLTDVVPPPGPLPVGSRMPLAPNPLFVGREQDLHALARWLKGTEHAATGLMQIAAVTGIGGVGKTQLATEFVHRYGPLFTGGVFWLSFADPAAVPTEVAACGLTGALDLRPDFAGLDLKERLALVVGAWQSRVPRLLVFDNCEDAALLDAWRPKSGGCRVLVTSRRATWAATLGIKPFPMSVLARTQSVALLRQYRPDLSADNTDLEAIAVEVADLPLALHLAGSVLALYRDELTPANYLAQVRGPERFDALEIAEEESGGPSPTHHAQSLRRTFALSYECLDPMNDGDALAQALLARAAYLAPGEPIPRQFLRTTLAHATHTPQVLREIGRSVRRLVDLGLLEETAEDTLRMHRLIVAFVRQEMPDADSQAAVEQALLESAAEPNSDTAHSSSRALEAHLSFVTDAAAERVDERAARLCAMRGAQLRWLGDYRRAEAYFKQALAIGEQVLGKRDSKIVAFLYDVGFVLKDQGKFPEAKKYFEQAFTITRDLRGEEHLETAVSLNNLGLLYKDLKKPLEAQGYFERALKITEAGGQDHPNSVASLHNLAWLLVDQGDQGLRCRARLYLERALRIQQEMFGEQDLRTVESLNGLGELLFRQGSFGDTVRSEGQLYRPERYPSPVFEPYKEAQSYFEQALAIRTKVLGERHPETAESLNNLGRLLARQDDTAAARSYFERALTILREVLGESHPRTAQVLANLGRLLGKTTDGLWEAKLNLEQARDILERTLGPEHPDTIEVRSDLSGLRRSGRGGVRIITRHDTDPV